MLIVGLTGGIGSGKSTVAEMFADLGVPVIDADLVARDLVTPGQPALAAIVVAFGKEILDTDGALQRKQLRSLIFSDALKRKRLETILHPLIAAEMQRRVEQLAAAYCVLCIPLLLESGHARRVHRILLVDAPHYLQYRRVMARDGISATEVAAIMRAQVPFRAAQARADDIIYNIADQSQLHAEVERLHQYYQTLASQSLPLPAN